MILRSVFMFMVVGLLLFSQMTWSAPPNGIIIVTDLLDDDIRALAHCLGGYREIKKLFDFPIPNRYWYSIANGTKEGEVLACKHAEASLAFLF